MQLNVNQLATLLGVHSETVIYWEYNRGTPKVSNCQKFIEVLGFLPFDFDTTTLSGRIKDYRFRKGLSRGKLSKILDVDETTLRDWEENRRKPKPEKMKILESFLGQ